jgi:hypothetical protein
MSDLAVSMMPCGEPVAALPHRLNPRHVALLG